VFYYRAAELAKLKAIYGDDRPQAVAIYGRRRTGKSELIRESFRRASGIRCFYYLCGSDTYKGNLTGFASELCSFLSLDVSLMPNFDTFRQAFVYFRPYFIQKKIVLAIDEFPYLVKKGQGAAIAHEFQKIIESDLAQTKATLVLCGSNVRYMKETIENNTSPLYGRFREILEVKPFTYQEVAPLFSQEKPFDVLCTYAATGGVAEYVFFFKEYPSFKQAVVDLFLSHSPRLLGETQSLLDAEFTETLVYVAILKRIAPKPLTAPKISAAIGLDNNSLYPYLQKLMSLGLVSAYKTAFSEKKRETRYYVSDPFFRFSYALIEPYRSQIDFVDGNALFDRLFTDEAIHSFLGHIYEDSVMKHVLSQLALDRKIDFLPEEMLPWLGNVKNEDGKVIETEIDLLAYDAHHIIIAECKAKNQKLGMKVYEDLLRKIPFVKCGPRKKRLLLASFSGFEDEVLSLKDKGVILISGTSLI
jgi:AAA+ ATPase superfamily predicted ATPase